MKRISFWFVVAATAAACVIDSIPFAATGADDEGSPIYGVKIPAGYRDWALVNVAHEAGDLNDLRVVLGNDVAMKAFRDRTLPLPDGAIIARLMIFRIDPGVVRAAPGARGILAGQPMSNRQNPVLAGDLDCIFFAARAPNRATFVRWLAPRNHPILSVASFRPTTCVD